MTDYITSDWYNRRVMIKFECEPEEYKKVIEKMIKRTRQLISKKKKKVKR